MNHNPASVRDVFRSSVLLACTALVVAASFIVPNVGPGRCGTAHYFLFQLAGYKLLNSLNPHHASQAIERILPVVLNGLVFMLVGLVWYRRGPRAQFVTGMAAWTALYLVSYLLLFPMPGCP